MYVSYQASSPDHDGGDDDLLARLRAGDRQVVNQLYRRHAAAFLKWAGGRHPGLTSADVEDAYQEAVISLYENLASGRLVQLTAELRTYLFHIGERYCIKFEKKRARAINVSAFAGIKDADFPQTIIEVPANLDEVTDDPFGLATLTDEEEARYERVLTAMKRLTAECRDLLTRFYYDSCSLTDLSEEFNHRDATVTRVRKSQCLGRLRELCRY